MDKNYVTKLEIMGKPNLMKNKKNCLTSLIKKIKFKGFKSNEKIITVINSLCEDKFNDTKKIINFLEIKENEKRVKVMRIDDFLDECEAYFNNSEFVIFYNFSWNTKNILLLLKNYLEFFKKTAQKITFFQLAIKYIYYNKETH